MCFSTLESRIADQTQIELIVSKKKIFQFYSLKEKITLEEEIDVDSVPVLFKASKDKICFATNREYRFLDRISGAMTVLFHYE